MSVGRSFTNWITIYMDMLDSEATLLPPSLTVGPFSLAVKWLALHQKFMVMLYLGGGSRHGSRQIPRDSVVPSAATQPTQQQSHSTTYAQQCHDDDP